MEFLIGGPFASPVGQRIQKATSAALQAEDWSLNLEICDIINETEDGPKDAMKALKKRIVGNKNFREVMLALTVLETCVKNCGNRFHVFVCTKEFVEGVLVRAILPKNNPPMILHDRVLSLIQSWADAFRNSPSLSGVVSVYENMRQKGLQFPMTDLDSLSPIHTPNRSTPDTETSSSSVSLSDSRTHTQSSPPAHTPQSVPSNGQQNLVSTEQKLRSELDLVKGNLTVMTEILNQVKPGETSASDTELLQQLYSVCKQMQQRVVELIPNLSEEEMFGELLLLNDDLNNAFIRYERFDRLNNTQRATTEQLESQTENGNLIDLSPVSQSANQSAVPAVNQCVSHLPSNQTQHSAVEDEEFDMFAQTRTSSLAEQRRSVRYEDPGAVEGLAEALDTRLQVTAGAPVPHSSAMEDIEKWLSTETADDEDSEGVTSEEFDKFLSERAQVADHLPSVNKSLSEVASHTKLKSHRANKSKNTTSSSRSETVYMYNQSITAPGSSQQSLQRNIMYSL
ncbi:target of Myb1 membrane trafficking protein-like isoform X2 [Xyrauchen texanus]|uniref:target of Myb1 membrane trafficking protein-like isoform X2 n=1 Tax=Xyrauchen texanus TaxID=154827 RepID=UPI002241F25D|nr:target of Myb1 membrane trafficking protein-like isoform X2 [Xyrauchen texanus]